jgi:hypothetical protein
LLEVHDLMRLQGDDALRAGRRWRREDGRGDGGDGGNGRTTCHGHGCLLLLRPRRAARHPRRARRHGAVGALTARGPDASVRLKPAFDLDGPRGVGAAAGIWGAAGQDRAEPRRRPRAIAGARHSTPAPEARTARQAIPHADRGADASRSRVPRAACRAGLVDEAGALTALRLSRGAARPSTARPRPIAPAAAEHPIESADGRPDAMPILLLLLLLLPLPLPLPLPPPGRARGRTGTARMLRRQEGRPCRRLPGSPRARPRLSRWFALGARWAAAADTVTARPPLEGAPTLACEAFLLGFGYALGSGTSAGAAQDGVAIRRGTPSPDVGRCGAADDASILPRSRRA